MQHGRVQVPLAELGVAPGQSFLVHELLDGTRYLWQGDWN
jgi:starch synthase (maltosyl-transferring)